MAPAAPVDSTHSCPICAVQRRGGRAVECTGLENRQGFAPFVGSNPTLSASNLVIYQYLNSILETIWNQSFFTEKLGS